MLAYTTHEKQETALYPTMTIEVITSTPQIPTKIFSILPGVSLLIVTSSHTCRAPTIPTVRLSSRVSMALVVIVIVWSVEVGVADSEDFSREQPGKEKIKRTNKKETQSHRGKKEDTGSTTHSNLHDMQTIPIMPLEREEPRFSEEEPGNRRGGESKK
jgi:hypothetical protein